MKAVLCKRYGPPSELVVEDVPSPKPGEGQVLVAVRAAGVNFPDTLIIQGKYQFKPELPFSPGGEVAGVVREVGAGVTGFKPGDRVIAVDGLGRLCRRSGGRGQALHPDARGHGLRPRRRPSCSPTARHTTR